MRLSNAIQQEPEPAGDATLVLRTHEFPDDKGFTGADLYLDSGRYFYAQTRKELRGLKEDTGSRAVKREINAAVAALELPPAEARARMIKATFDGHEPPEDAAPRPPPWPRSARTPTSGISSPPARRRWTRTASGSARWTP